jgi:serine protease inhibitor
MKRTYLWAVVLILLAGCGTSGVQVNDPTRNTTQPRNNQSAPRNFAKVPGDIMKQVTIAQNDFGFRAFEKLAADESGNIFFSPFSAAMALGMTYNGAAGETKEAMAKALGIEAMQVQTFNNASAQLMQTLMSAAPSVQLLVANSLWTRQGFTFKPDFLQTNRQFYQAEVRNLDFADPRAADTINQWVSNSTNGLIKKMIDEIKGDTVMILMNALYFKGTWQRQFDEKATQQQTFHAANGKEMQVPMMSQSGHYLYLKGTDFQAIALPYKGNSISMLLFLPSEGKPLSGFLKQLSQGNWERWQSGFMSKEGDIRIPRFNIEFEKTLNNTLKAMGMEIAFDETHADFSGMWTPAGGERLFIQQVKQKAVVDVNETGTEAAAVTSVEVGVTSAPIPSERFKFVADRPFFFVIQDNRTGTILFMGTLQNP